MDARTQACDEAAIDSFLRRGTGWASSSTSASTSGPASEVSHHELCHPRHATTVPPTRGGRRIRQVDRNGATRGLAGGRETSPL